VFRYKRKDSFISKKVISMGNYQGVNKLSPTESGVKPICIYVNGTCECCQNKVESIREQCITCKKWICPRCMVNLDNKHWCDYYHTCSNCYKPLYRNDTHINQLGKYNCQQAS
jgi:hypothetical protein